MAWLEHGVIKKDQKLEDWLNLIFAVALFVSPWTLDYSGDRAATNTAWISAGIVGALALADIIRVADWKEWVTVVTGICLIATPWSFAYFNVSNAVFAHVLLGVLIACMSAERLVRSFRTARSMRAAALLGRTLRPL